MTAAYNTTRHFAKQEISYKAIFTAQQNKKIKNVYFSFSLDIKYDFKKINKKKVKMQLYNHFFPKNKFSGIYIYDRLIEYYKNSEYIVMTRPKLICEHIDIISKLNGIEIKIDCSKIIKLSHQLFYISIKYNLTSYKKLLNKCLLLINEIKTSEIAMFKDCFCNECS